MSVLDGILQQLATAEYPQNPECHEGQCQQLENHCKKKNNV